MKIADYKVISVGPTPREVKNLRQEIYDYHLKLGEPVVFKHRWNLIDAQNGLTSVCPNSDLSYHRSKTDCPICFGTNFTGGFADGVILFLTIADTPVDQLKIDKQGYIMFDQHPDMTAPWIPNLGDGDLIIRAQFDRATWSIISTEDRYELNDVRPVTMRGPFVDYTAYSHYKIQQMSKLDRLPNTHVFYNVPIEFNYNNLPVVIPPAGADPDDYTINSSTIIHGLRMIAGGDGIKTAATSQEMRITGGGTTITTAAYGLNITGTINTVRVGFE